MSAWPRKLAGPLFTLAVLAAVAYLLARAPDPHPAADGDAPITVVSPPSDLFPELRAPRGR